MNEREELMVRLVRLAPQIRDQAGPDLLEQVMYRTGSYLTSLSYSPDLIKSLVDIIEALLPPASDASGDMCQPRAIAAGNAIHGLMERYPEIESFPEYQAFRAVANTLWIETLSDGSLSEASVSEYEKTADAVIVAVAAMITSR